MKKLIALIAVLLMTLTAFAGPYFILENRATVEWLDLAPALTIGVDWETTIGDVFTGPSFGGDFSVGFDNILAPIAVDNLWTTTFDVDIDWGAVRCEFRSLLEINPQLYPTSVEITDSSYGQIKVVGVPGDIVEVWGGLKLAYTPIPVVWPDPAVPGAWAPILFFGIEVHLD